VVNIINIILLLFIIRGNQYVHLKIEFPKKLSDRQKELLKEFELEQSKSEQESSKIKATIEKAWDRLKKFMGTTSSENDKSKTSK
jgi:molecular chaperone DnaJ